MIIRAKFFFGCEYENSTWYIDNQTRVNDTENEKMLKSVLLTLTLCIKIDARSEERGVGMELFRREQYLSKIRGFYHDKSVLRIDI